MIYSKVYLNVLNMHIANIHNVNITVPEAPKGTKKSVRFIFVRFLFFCSNASLQKKGVRFFFLADVLCIKSNPVGSITYGSGLNIFVLF